MVLYYFGKVKICDMKVVMMIEKEVFGFEIMVDNVLWMEVFNGKDDRCEIEFGDIGGKLFCLLKMWKKFVIWNVR